MNQNIRAIPMSRVFDEMFDTFFRLSNTESAGAPAFPPANVYTDGNKLYFELAAAGYDIQDLGIEVKDNKLVITGNPPNDTFSEGTKFWEHRIARRKFERSWVLGNLVDLGTCSASFNDGLLCVTFHIVEEAKPKRIEIQTLKQLN